MRKLLPALALSVLGMSATVAGAAAIPSSSTISASPQEVNLSQVDIQESKQLQSLRVWAKLSVDGDTPADVRMEATQSILAGLAYLQESAVPGQSALKAEAVKQLEKLLAYGIKDPATSDKALFMMTLAYGDDTFGIKNHAKAVKTLKEAADKGIPFSNIALALAYTKGELGLEVDSVKALAHLDADTAPASATFMAFKAAVLADKNFATTFDMGKAIATARVAYHLDPQNEQAVGLLGGLLMSTGEAAQAEEGQALISVWIEARKEKVKEQALKRAEAAIQKRKPVLHEIDPNSAETDAATKSRRVTVVKSSIVEESYAAGLTLNADGTLSIQPDVFQHGWAIVRDEAGACWKNTVVLEGWTEIVQEGHNLRSPNSSSTAEEVACP